ncbi:MAG: DUF1015 domain-containing protein [Verrucomicrobiales bacterium]|nr:DUF1015 domain-containing protein [Verrucomicrobiales bacterium]
MKTKAFPALVPAPGFIDEVPAVPYDVINSEEAAALATGKPNSLLHVSRPEIDFPEGSKPTPDELYQKAAENLKAMQANGSLIREEKPCVYVYRQQMGDHVQTGITLACHIDDYANNVIRKHEKTRPDKENDRTRLADTLNAHIGPVFLTYKDDATIDTLVEKITSEQEPDMVTTDEAGVIHTAWRIEGGEDITTAFENVPLAYVADGHHRTASAARVGRERGAANPDHDGSESYNWFLTVLFPSSQLNILSYNRYVHDLNGLSTEKLLQKIGEICEVTTGGSGSEPADAGQVCMYLEEQWYHLKLPSADSDDPVAQLDVSILQDQILTPLLAIDDPRTSNRISFVGGIRGTGELEKLVDKQQQGVAFSLYPVSIDQLIAISDADQIMAPKSTWFEPKLRSGMFIYTID